jgi:L-amino acid N-acyltransferase YncA
MSLLIRPSADADIPAVAEIYAHAVVHGTASFEMQPPSADEMARRRTALVASGYPYLVAVRDGAVVGYAYAGAYRARPAYRSTIEDSIYVAAAAQGRGVGRTLLDALVRDSERHGFRQMVAVIGDSASSGSIRLHESLGFRHVGVLQAVGHKHGRWLDTVLMQRQLGVGTAEPPDVSS